MTRITKRTVRKAVGTKLLWEKELITLIELITYEPTVLLIPALIGMLFFSMIHNFITYCSQILLLEVFDPVKLEGN
ncbi:hypothetical protein WUBG_17545, partial [Wuchereria bancrofti]